MSGIRESSRLLDAIKAQLNRDLRPGRYVLAGSTRYAAIPAAAQVLTGRVDIIPVLPLTQGEIDGVRETFVARLLDGDEIAGLPPGRSRSRWFANYVDLVVDKDVMDISRVRQREMLPRLLGQLAARSGQVLNLTPVAGAIGLERSTAENYVKLLEAVFSRLPPPVVGHDPRLPGCQASQGAYGRLDPHRVWPPSRDVRGR